MKFDPAAPAGGDLVYRYRPSLLGAAHEFKLAGDGIEWSAGARSGRVPFRDVRRVRMSFKPVSMQSHRYRTEVWAEGPLKLEIVSSSWKSMVEQERLDKPYSAFVAELHRRILLAAAPVRFEHGSNQLMYWPGLILFVGVGLGLALLVVRALQTGAMGGAAFIAAFLVLFLWQGGNFFHRNRPGIYRADALPAAVMPKG
jgi:hypothetical protein